MSDVDQNDDGSYSREMGKGGAERGKNERRECGYPPLMPIVFESRIATLVTFGADGRLAPAWPDLIRAELEADVATAAIVEVVTLSPLSALGWEEKVMWNRGRR